MDVQQLGASLGAEIVGIDLGQKLNAQDIADIRQAVLAHHVIVFRKQNLTPEDQIRFGSTLGTLVEHPVFPHLEGYPPLIEIRNYGKKYSLNEHWHTDVSFTEKPPAFSLLYALDMPQTGGDTQFANQCLALNNMSPAMQTLLGGLRARHIGGGTAKLAGKDASEAPTAVHPVIRRHPETGRKALYVCRAFTECFDTLSKDESSPLLNWLFTESTRYEYTFRHQWQTGDLVVWDNRSTLHYAIHDHGDSPRLLHRATVEGEVPE